MGQESCCFFVVADPYQVCPYSYWPPTVWHHHDIETLSALLALCEEKALAAPPPPPPPPPPPKKKKASNALFHWHCWSGGRVADDLKCHDGHLMSLWRCSMVCNTHKPVGTKKSNTWVLFYLHELALILAWIGKGNYVHYEVSGELISISKLQAVEVREWICNFMSDFKCVWLLIQAGIKVNPN